MIDGLNLNKQLVLVVVLLVHLAGLVHTAHTKPSSNPDCRGNNPGRFLPGP